MMKKNRAMTLSEVIITLIIIGVVAAITIPILNHQRPDLDAIMYKKAVYSIGAAFNRASLELEEKAPSCKSWADTTGTCPDEMSVICPEENGTAQNCLCSRMFFHLNTSGKANCPKTSNSSSYASPNFRTTDGMIFWGLENAFNSNDELTIYIERHLKKAELKSNNQLKITRDSEHTTPGLRLVLTSEGGIKVPSSSTLSESYEETLAKKMMEITK